MNILTSDRIITMTDNELCEQITAHTGVSTLYCTHCKRATPIQERWVVSLRRRLLKLAKSSGAIALSSSIAFPKTCDSQTLKNDKSNPINNSFYPQIRKAFKKGDADEVKELQKMRGAHHIIENSIVPCPYKYSPAKSSVEYYIEEPQVKKSIKLRLRPAPEPATTPTIRGIIDDLSDLDKRLKARLIQ